MCVSEAWLSAMPSFVVAVGLFVVPGLIVRLAGWRTDALVPYLLVPALSAGVVAVSSNAAGLLHVPWSPLVVVVVTLVVAAVAFVLRRWVGRESATPLSLGVIVAAVGGLVLAAAVIVTQLTWAFVGPDNISQTFDNIVHLNAIRLTLDAGDASAFAVGRTSDIGFYPNAWHSFVTLVASTTGVDIPAAVNTTNLAIGAIVWPASTMALAAVLFHGRASAVASAAALSTGFGAFPALLLYFGVLYPNMMAYALLPAGLAVVLLLLRMRGPAPQVVRTVALALVVLGAVGLAHPNAFLAIFAIGAVLTILQLFVRAVHKRDRRTWITSAVATVVILAVGAGLWRFSRTPYEMSRWGNWQSTAQAFGEAFLLSPRSYPLTLAVSALIVIGLVTIVRFPKHYQAAVPFAVAGFLFVLAAGLPTGTLIRELLTNPWYNDPFRFAALLPVAGIPVAVLGAMTVVDASGWALRRLRSPRVLSGAIAVVAAVALFGVGLGPNVRATLADARASYEYTDASSLLTADEATLLARLDETTPEDAVIIGNPWTGASLAFALAGREVVERHIFGTRTDDEVFVDENLRDIDTDPLVCAAIDRIGATYVLDFGSQNVFNDPNSGLDRAGLDDLSAGTHLELVDSEGDHARLFRVTGC